MRSEEVVPDPQLMESMRAVGYTLETAVADIIDNSITAGADRVDVRFTATPEPRVAVIDNGSGMDEESLLQAMKLAGRSPSSARGKYDLGRFGLGLKTASLSQARSLTVATKQGELLQAVSWDLDHLKAVASWSLQWLEGTEITSLPWIESLAGFNNGTLVLWEKLDQLHVVPGQVEGQLDELMKVVRDHLGLVFHRFTSTTMPPLKNPLTLTVNGAPVPRVDPFLKQNQATQEGPREIIRIGKASVAVQPYTLPYITKLKAADRQLALIAGELRDSQGFYVYRAGRLVLWGTWFRIMPRDELGKLARVQVDVPNSLDHLWALDIKKSAASPPPEVKQRLKQIAGKIVQPSRRVHEFRGRRVEDEKLQRLWTLIAERGTFRYELNRGHPLIEKFAESLDPSVQPALSQLLRAIEATFPVEDAYNRLGSDNAHAPSSIQTSELIELARTIYELRGVGVDVLAHQLVLVEPFSSIRDLESFLREAIDE